MDIQIFKDQISAMSTTDLRTINNLIVAQLKYRRSADLVYAKNRLYVGANCRVDHPKAVGKTFIVQKINQKNVKCIEANNPRTIWTINAAMLQVIG